MKKCTFAIIFVAVVCFSATKGVGQTTAGTVSVGSQPQTQSEYIGGSNPRPPSADTSLSGWVTVLISLLIL